MQDEAGMLLEPSLDLDGAVSAVIVDHQMERRVARKLPVDTPKKLQELLLPVSLVTVADHLSLEYIQRGKQRSRPVPFVVVGHGSATAFLQRQARLSAV